MGQRNGNLLTPKLSMTNTPKSSNNKSPIARFHAKYAKNIRPQPTHSVKNLSLLTIFVDTKRTHVKTKIFIRYETTY